MGTNRILIPIFLLCCLLRLGITAQAQENISWEAEFIVMSPNGRHLAVRYDADETEGNEFSREVWIYNLDDLSSAPRHLANTYHQYTRLSISPDSQQIAVAEKGRIRVFNTGDHSKILDFSYTWPERSVIHHSVSFGPDSRHIMYYRNLPQYLNESGADEGRIIVWDTETGLRDLEISYRSQDIADKPWLSPDWRQLMDRSHSDGLRIYEFNSERGLGSRISTFSEAALGLAFNADSSLFALATLEDEIHVYQTDTWDLTYIQVLSEHTCRGKYVMLAFDHTNPWLACLGNERLSVWDIETGKLLLMDKIDAFFGLIAWNEGMLFADNRRYTGSKGKAIIAWDANNEFERTTYPGKYPQLHPNGELMTTIGPDFRVWLWNIRSKQFLTILPVPQP